MGFLALDIFGSAPSKQEAVDAVHDLQMIPLPQTISRFAGDEANFFSEGAIVRRPLLHEQVKIKSLSGLERSRPGQQIYKSSSVLSQTQHKILNALHLLLVNSSVKDMVVSLSTDKAVWNAVMKNEMVREFKKTYHVDKYLKHVEYASDANPDITAQILSWLFGIAKAAVMKFMDDIFNLVSKLFDQQTKENTMETVSDLVSSSFMLSVLVFIIVILKRSWSSIDS
ncbi:uncharacterized protein LOC110018969 [Phalaenopsis equestris]|uniref:uncharacterized protein LOC110018969 n=1 Tax=Phalaenopsis equestris TaxID=78828 RepID=UPI0009E4D66F|nr:uncharacterized protein LOC110018969 [Phalaenopsis equestris]